MTGEELRKSRRPFAVTKSKATANFRPTSPREESETSRKNTNLKGLTSFILPNVSNNKTSSGKKFVACSVRVIAISENTGDVMVKNTPMTIR